MARNVCPGICILASGTIHSIITMKKKGQKQKFRITEQDYLLANRKASRQEELEAHDRQISLRRTVHKSKKVYDRNALKRQARSLDLPILFAIPE